ncbi:hypothetical protein [Pedobacter gandavensis]|uniref:hypothetical protein n=1 Tax=Pedobacter gandavensis TaxID=2679963 RepID=UPI0029302A00|nr:hypothetical protein [Pedobacter gandavensis]
MKPLFKNKGWKGYALIALSTSLLSCEGGDAIPNPERKKMPRFNSSGLNQEDEVVSRRAYTSCGMSFETDLVNLDNGTGNNQYICIPLADAEADESAFTLINMFKPFASIYLSQWAKMEKKGIMLDLRSNRQQQGSRVDYNLEKGESFSIPVIILWDSASALRASSFKQLVGNLPGITSVKVTPELSYD